MRVTPVLSLLLVLALPESAQEPVEEGDQRAAPRVCTPAQLLVPPFNNTPEAMEQSRIAATLLRGDEICKTSPIFPEKSLIEHGEEQPVLPEEAAAEPVEEPAPTEPA